MDSWLSDASERAYRSQNPVVADGDAFYAERPLDDLTPISIVQARYGGLYEGGRWLAFLLEADELPNEAFDDDPTCREWWDDASRLPIGRGTTPDAALDDLRVRVARLTPERSHEPRYDMDQFHSRYVVRWPSGVTSEALWTWRGPGTGPRG